MKNMLNNVPKTTDFGRDALGKTLMSFFLNALDEAHSKNVNGIKDDMNKVRNYQTKHDAVTGGGIGGATGLALGGLLDKENDTVAKKLVNRMIGTGVGIGIGAGSGILAGKTDLINRLYQKLGERFSGSNLLAKRDMSGRLTSLIDSKNEGLDKRIKRLDTVAKGIDTYKDKLDVLDKHLYS